MKKNTIKAFTLVEMLIVIVIIGILIASLMPRMQTAQGRARDVARKNDLSQIQTAIITSQTDRKSWPGYWTNPVEDSTVTRKADQWMKISDLSKNLLEAWMSSIPTDPNGDNVNYWLWTLGEDEAIGDYIYVIAERNWVPDAWFALMAKTEVEWSSNWVVCQNSWGMDSNGNIEKWYIKNDDDLSEITLCKQVKQKTWGCSAKPDDNGICYYNETAELRYLLLY